MENHTNSQKGITIYCGSSAGNNPSYVKAASDVGEGIARKGLPLIYGGGHMGLMGAAGRSALAAGGRTIAVIPQFMVERGWNDSEASETIVTPSMHVRKETMAHMAHGVIAMPGGIGTFEELSEIITWRQLGLFSGNIVILNIDHYYDNWLNQIRTAISEGFMPPSHLNLFYVATSPTEAVEIAAGEISALSIQAKF